jgi:hypothetical protein
MWPWDDEMQAFKALSYGDQLRVSRRLTRGEAPGIRGWQSQLSSWPRATNDRAGPSQW